MQDQLNYGRQTDVPLPMYKYLNSGLYDNVYASASADANASASANTATGGKSIANAEAGQAQQQEEEKEHVHGDGGAPALDAMDRLSSTAEINAALTRLVQQLTAEVKRQEVTNALCIGIGLPRGSVNVLPSGTINPNINT